MAFYHTFTSARVTIPDSASLLAAVRAAVGAEAGVAVDDGDYRVKKSTDFSAADLAACQSAIDTAPAMSPQLAAQHVIDILPIVEKAILLVLFDENNRMREWLQAFKNAVAAATSLSNLQARVAALPDMPDRTVAQAIQAVRDKAGTL